MQALQQIPIDIVDVIQSVIVLFIAAPPLVRTMFRLPKPGSTPKAPTPAAVAEGTSSERRDPHALGRADRAREGDRPQPQDADHPGVFTLAALVFAFVIPRSGISSFRLSTSSDFMQIPMIELPTVATVDVLAIVLVLLGILTHLIVAMSRRGRSPLWLSAIFAVLFLFLFLAWARSGAARDPDPGPPGRRARACDASRLRLARRRAR